MSEKRFPVEKTDDEWQQTLTPAQYAVLRSHGTEPPGSCALLAEKRAGTFSCAGCGQALFVTGRKFESGTGWPSFFEPLRRVDRHDRGPQLRDGRAPRCTAAAAADTSGHVFPDGPPPTGQRYCINGVVLNFEPASS